MIFTKENQAELRAKFINDCLDKAWSTSAQVAFIREVQMQSIHKDVMAAKERIAAIDEAVKELEESKEYNAPETRAKVNANKTEKHEIEARLNGAGTKENPGLISMMLKMNNVAMQYEAEAERLIQLAEFSKKWDFKEAETTAPDKAEKKSEAKK